MVIEDLVAIIFIAYGVWVFVSPKSAVDFKIQMLKSIGMKMQVSGSPKGYQTLKYIGIGLAIVGFLIYLK